MRSSRLSCEAMRTFKVVDLFQLVGSLANLLLGGDVKNGEKQEAQMQAFEASGPAQAVMERQSAPQTPFY